MSDDDQFLTPATLVLLGGYLTVTILAVVISPFGPITLPVPVWFGSAILLTGVFVGLQLSSKPFRKRLGRLAGVAAAVLTVAWGLPWLHYVIYGLVFANPGGLQWLVLGIIIGVPLVISGSRSSHGDTTLSLQELGGGEFSLPDIELSVNLRTTIGGLALILGLIGFLIVGPLVSDLYAKEAMADRVEDSAIEIDQPPESVANRSRIVPKGVASNWIENSLQYPRYTSFGGDITYINGTPHWSYALSPDGAVNIFTRKQRGAVYVNQSSMTKDILVHDDQRFEYGQGVAITDSYSWQLKQEEFTNDYRDPFVVPHKNESYLVVPYVEHSWEFRATPLPQAYAVPEFGGVKIIDQDGNIETVPADETTTHPILSGQNYYPYGLARFKVSSLAYKNGILNTVIGHEGQIELADVPGDGNSQPFTIPTEDGPTYLLAVEPWGKASGVFEIWTVDAQTGEMAVTPFDQQNALRGPRKAIESITASPEIARLNNVKGVEPIPVVRDGTLYWQVRIIPNSSARITFVAFFNADTEEVTVVETTQGVRAFLAGQDVSENGTQASDDSQDETDACGLEIVAEYPDGTSETICVPEGTSVTIKQNSTSNTTG